MTRLPSITSTGGAAPFAIEHTPLHTYTTTVFVLFHSRYWCGTQGPCRTKPPYFGFVKRAMNRAPGPRDPWWARHAQSCGGTFEKVLSPPAPPGKPKPKRQRTAGTERPQPAATEGEKKR